jgi:hypothetical protein
MKRSSRLGRSSTTGRRSSPPASRSTTAGTSGSSSVCTSGAGLPRQGARELVPVVPDRAGERAGGRGRCERCATIVEQRDLEQWFLKITDYADRLDDGLDQLEEWPDKVRTMQRNWIGKSLGADVDFHRCPKLGRESCASSRPDPTRSSARRHGARPRASGRPALIADSRQRGDRGVDRGSEESEQPRAGVGGKEGRFTGSMPSIRSPARRSRSGSGTSC